METDALSERRKLSNFSQYLSSSYYILINKYNLDYKLKFLIKSYSSPLVLIKDNFLMKILILIILNSYFMSFLFVNR